MLNRRTALGALTTGAGLTLIDAAGAQARGDGMVGRTTLASAHFAIETDAATGGLCAVRHPRDPAAMSWIGGPQVVPWKPAGSLWGLGYAEAGGGMGRIRWDRPVSVVRDGLGTECRYEIGELELTVTRRLDGDALVERYVFKNAGASDLALAGRGTESLAIYTPFNDHYTSSEDVMEHRCHAHIWAGGSSSWVAMLRMGGRAPHLGMVVTEGAVRGYSIEDRDVVTSSNTRGTVLLHPAIDRLKPGETAALGWTLFWHAGWDDFFVQARRRSRQMVQVEAGDLTAYTGEVTRLLFRGDLGTAPMLNMGEQSVPLTAGADGWRATLPTAAAGERSAELRYGNGLRTHVALNTMPALDTLIERRVRFIVDHQQWHKAGDPWDGAYIVYDNQTDVMLRREPWHDFNDCRERIGMGVLIARWLRQRRPARLSASNGVTTIRRSLDRYYRYINEVIQKPDGYVRNGAGDEYKRLYNWPWVMQLHIEMGRLSGDPQCWRRLMTTIESFYREGGAAFYAIGIPVVEAIRQLERSGLTDDRARALALFTGHAEQIERIGTAYPPHEVNFEQTIVQPAANLLLELNAVTGDERWLRAARPHVALLDLFEGRQPDHRLHHVAIRHWDGYWFGKARMWGDTFPHYWSSLNALVWELMYRATGQSSWKTRSETVLRNNLSAFSADGSASCAYIYPVTVAGRAGRFADLYANDQDWALVHALQLRDRAPSSMG